MSRRLVKIANDERSRRTRLGLIARRAVKAQRYQPKLEKKFRPVTTDDDVDALDELLPSRYGYGEV